MLRKKRGRPAKSAPTLKDMKPLVKKAADHVRETFTPPEETAFTIDFGECAEPLRKLAKKQKTTPELLIAGMIALHLQED